MKSLLFPSLAFAYYTYVQMKMSVIYRGFHFRPRSNKGSEFSKRVRRRLISLYIHHNTLHRCLNCPLSAQNERNPILSAVCSPAISAFSHTHTHTHTHRCYTPPDSNYRAADAGWSAEQLMHTYTFLHLYTIKDQIRI